MVRMTDRFWIDESVRREPFLVESMLATRTIKAPAGRQNAQHGQYRVRPGQSGHRPGPIVPSLAVGKTPHGQQERELRRTREHGSHQMSDVRNSNSRRAREFGINSTAVDGRAHAFAKPSSKRPSWPFSEQGQPIK